MKNKFAFTLVETLIMMAVIGIIATVSVVSLKGMRPDKDAMMIKKVYSTIVQIVDTLANDTDLYPYAHITGIIDKLIPVKTTQSALLVWPPNPKGDCSDDGGTYDEISKACLTKEEINLNSISHFGEGNYLDRRTECDDAEGEVCSGKFTDITVRNTGNYDADNKFAFNFISRLDQPYFDGCEGRLCDTRTRDGVHWYVEDYFSDSSKRYAIITVDLNGDDGPDSSTDSNPDVYNFMVDANGAVTVYGDDTAAAKAREVLKSRNIKAKN